MQSSDDRYTFQFAQLKGKSYYAAFGKVTNDFLHIYRNKKHYEVILTAFLERLFSDPSKLCQDDCKILVKSLQDRHNAHLAEKRAQDQVRVHKGRKPVYELPGDDYDYDDDYYCGYGEDEPEEVLEERYARQLEEEKRIAAREEERRRNEEELRARARKVDNSGFEELLQKGVVLNMGNDKKKGGGKQQHHHNAVSAENLKNMERQVALLMKEKLRLQMVLQLNEEELQPKLTEIKEESEVLMSKLNASDNTTKGTTGGPAAQQKQITSRMAELTQKQTKLTMERNRLALQFKTQATPLREELLALLKQRDEVQVKIDIG
uniref:Uncharacterized protein n=1 Tax=Trypanosoma congolense (strain IL3000) TaxID=1068625 RepID=G0UNG3_TRYCI|nr:conserved hypothetical protein [Trypanosoma congolense IL3000]